MQPFRFIHCGDLHLGAPFQYAMGMSRHVDRAVAEATYEAFNNVSLVGGAYSRIYGAR